MESNRKRQIDMKMIIKKAELNDLQEILDLQYLAYQSEAELFNDHDIPPLKQTLEDVLAEYQNGIILKVSDMDNVIPTGFCYQKLILDDETAPVLIYHGLNGVYISEYEKWIRLDARGNKEGVNAQFSLDEEHLAFPIRTEKGEEDGFIIYPNPDRKVLERLRKYKTRTELWGDLPTNLDYIS